MAELDKQRRKALISEYKRTPKEMGVYGIRNTSNGKMFVARSRDIQARFNRHRMQLKTKSDDIKPLQLDWDEFGEQAFVFETLDTLEPSEKIDYDPTSDLEILEQLWLERLKPWGDKGYNKEPKF